MARWYKNDDLKNQVFEDYKKWPDTRLKWQTRNRAQATCVDLTFKSQTDVFMRL